MWSCPSTLVWLGLRQPSTEETSARRVSHDSINGKTSALLACEYDEAETVLHILARLLNIKMWVRVSFDAC